MLKIKELRTEFGLSVREMALMLDIHYTTISKYEQNLRTMNIESLVMLSKFFQVEEGYLLGTSNEGIICTCFAPSGTFYPVISREQYLKHKNEIYIRKPDFKRVISSNAWLEISRDNEKAIQDDFSNYYLKTIQLIKSKKGKALLETLPDLTESQIDSILNEINEWKTKKPSNE